MRVLLLLSVKYQHFGHDDVPVLGSIVVSIPACHAGDRGSIPRRGGRNFIKITISGC